MQPMTRYSFNFPTAQFTALKDEHARTYPQHRQSFNAWILARLIAATPKG